MRGRTWLFAVPLILTVAVAAAQTFVRREVVVNPFGDNGTVIWDKTSDSRSPSGYRDYANDEYEIRLAVSGAFVERFLTKHPLAEVWVEDKTYRDFDDLWKIDTSPPGTDNPETFATAFKVPISHGGKTITSRYEAARHSMWPGIEFWAWYAVDFSCLTPGEYTFGANPVAEYHGATAALGKKYDYHFQYVIVATASNTPPRGWTGRHRVFRQQPFTLRLEPHTSYRVYYVYTTGAGAI